MFRDNSIIILIQNTQPRVFVTGFHYTRKNAQVATDLQTSCNKSVHKLLTRCIRTACSEFVRTSLEQLVDNFGTSSANTSC